MNNWVCEARDCRWHSKAVICLDVSDCFYSLMGTLPIKAQFTASRGNCKDVAVFLSSLFKWQRLLLDYEWQRIFACWINVLGPASGLFELYLLILVFLHLTSEFNWPSFNICYAINRTNYISSGTVVRLYTVTFI